MGYDTYGRPHKRLLIINKWRERERERERERGERERREGAEERRGNVYPHAHMQLDHALLLLPIS
jgi:hypothetical protein